FLLIICLAEKTIQILFTQVSHDFLLSTSHYTKEILLLNSFPESLEVVMNALPGATLILVCSEILLDVPVKLFDGPANL
ncbi:hypothetical protein ACYJ1Y_17845, partial [Natrialbaceae archaeon A-gly3]